MSIHYQILGTAGRDNSLFLKIDSGNKLYRILIDCGENTIPGISQSDIKSIDILLLSHLHLDHIAGFDYFFRRTFDRNTEGVNIFGPEETSAILHHRFLGFKWNLTEGLNGSFYVHDILREQIGKYRYEAHTGFSEKIFIEQQSYNGIVLQNDHFTISAALLNHRIPSIGYAIKEADSVNINKEILRMNYEAGPWLNKLKDKNIPDDEIISTGEKNFTARYLREKLLYVTQGESITYLTDFISDEFSYKAAVDLASGTDTLICESQYLNEDSSLAEQNYHLTANQAAAIAKAARVKKLILFHISERYIHNKEKLRQMLNESCSVFPETYYPEHWKAGH